MDKDKLKDIEKKYLDLKNQLNHGEITSDKLKKALKKLMILDNEGNYWMIGGRTGKWYFHDGSDWKERNPFESEDETNNNHFDSPSNQEPQQSPADQAEPIHQYETIDHSDAEDQQNTADNNIEEEQIEVPPQEPSDPDMNAALEQSETRLYSNEESNEIHLDSQTETPQPEEEIKEPIAPEKTKNFHTDPFHTHLMDKKPAAQEKKQMPLSTPETSAILSPLERKPGKEYELEIESINKLSFLFFMGGLGLIAGVIFGAIFGIYPILGDFINNFGSMLAETRGGFAGGLLFAAIGGISGFIFFAILSVVLSLLYDFLSYIFGGIKIKVKPQ